MFKNFHELCSYAPYDVGVAFYSKKTLKHSVLPSHGYSFCFGTCKEISYNDCKFVASKLKDQAKENRLIYGSDGEFALENSLEKYSR